MSERIRLTTASDYAVLEVGAKHFYYGYEFDEGGDGEAEDTWGFEYKRGGVSARRWSYRDLVVNIDRAPTVWETHECLLVGLGRVLAED